MELGLSEIMLILFVALMVYGGRLPKVALAVGRSLGELKRGLRETSDMVRREVEGVDDVRRGLRETTDRARRGMASIDPRRAVRRAWQESESIIDDAVAKSGEPNTPEAPPGEPPADADADRAVDGV